MQKKAIIVIVFIMTVLVAIVSVSTPVNAANWQPVTTITGSGTQTTNEFMVNGSEWRIRWSYTPDAEFPDLTAFSFFVYPHSETSAYVGHVIQYKAEITSGTLDLNDGTGLHYITVLATNTRSYTLIVEYNTESVASDSLLFLIVSLALGIPIVLIVIISFLVRKRVKKRKLLASQQFPSPPPPPP